MLRSRGEVSIHRRVSKALLRMPEDQHPIPDFRVDEQPQAIAVVRAPARVLFDQSLDRLARQYPRLDQLGVAQIASVELRVLVPQNVRQRRGESLLGARENF